MDREFYVIEWPWGITVWADVNEALVWYEGKEYDLEREDCPALVAFYSTEPPHGRGKGDRVSWSKAALKKLAGNYPDKTPTITHYRANLYG